MDCGEWDGCLAGWAVWFEAMDTEIQKIEPPVEVGVAYSKEQAV